MDEKFIDMAERIAALEEQSVHGQRDRDEMKRDIKTANADVSAIRRDLHALLNKVSKWEGKFGGVIFIVGCLWAFLVGVPGAILDWIKTFGSIGK